VPGAEAPSTPQNTAKPDLFAIGEVFAERYRIDSKLGEGGMGTVYRAHDLTLGEDVAIKVLSFRSNPSSEDLERFHREVRLARRITHINVARTHDIGEHEGRHYLSMELVAGKSLESYLGRATAASEAVALGIAIVQGLRAAHQAGVVHRDLKPANVLVERAGRVVLTDFGIARGVRDASVTEVGQTVGTPRYMSPEQVLGEAADARSDLYAVGLILYELLTGTFPFEGNTPMALAVARLQSDVEDPSNRVPMPRPLADIVLRCLARNPTERFDSADDLATALLSWSESSSAQTMAMPIAPADSMPVPPPVSTAGTKSSRPPFAPITVGSRSVAVLPFLHRGSADSADLAETLAEELIDVMSRIRDVRVLAYGATSRFVDERDPRAVGEELGAHAVVDGTVQVSGLRLRISVRLIDVPTGIQTWNGRFESEMGDIFELQERLSRRIAEELRTSLTAESYRDRVDPEAMALYLQGRKRVRGGYLEGTNRAPDLFARAIELEPTFAPAIAAHALACVRSWWQETVSHTPRSMAEDAKMSVARALDVAPGLAETQLAEGMLQLQLGNLERDLQCEAGRVEEGLRRLRLATDLDPSFKITQIGMARVAALRQQWPEYDEHIKNLQQSSDITIARMLLRLRVAAWRGDHQLIRQLIEEAGVPTTPVLMLVVVFAQYVLGDLDTMAIRRARDFSSGFDNPRVVALVEQVLAEGFGLRGETDLAMEAVQLAAAQPLVDVEWMKRCPALDPIRDRPEFAEAFATVKARANAIWRG